MRRTTLAMTAAVAAATLALAGCGSDPETDPGAPADPGSEIDPSDITGEEIDDGDLPGVSGEFGDKPELTFPDDEAPEGPAVRVLSEGDGPTVEAGELLLANYLGQVWGGEVFDNSYDRGSPSAFGIGVNHVITGWDLGLVGQQVGSRVLLSLPPALGYGEAGNPNAGIAGTDTIVFVVDIVDSFGADTAGDAEAVPGEDLPADGPQVEGELGGPASVSIPAGATEPEEESVTVVAAGSGTPVEQGTVIVHYAFTYFGDDEAGPSTWAIGMPEQISAGPGGAVEDLVGVPVGSRVLLLLPAQGEQPAAAAVLDVLAQP